MMKQPYNCTKPGNLFVGYNRFIHEILSGLRNGHSFALIGGRRCGKTSLLIQIEKKLSADGLEPFQVQAHRFSIQRFDKLSAEHIFGYIYKAIAKGCSLDDWPNSTPRGAYQAFLELLEKGRSVLVSQKGEDWLVVLLIDELDAAIKCLLDDDDTFFQNLRHLLMDSPFCRHLRIVASGATEMASLISSGSSPLNNLRHKYLRVLTEKHARELVQAGFEDDYEERHLYKLTGRHPYLLQGLLEKLWEQRPDCWQKGIINQVAMAFLKEHKDFVHWLDHFGPAEIAVYRQLSSAPNETLSFTALKNQLPLELRADIEDAITVLSYHGVIDDSDPEEPEIAGSLFKNWFHNKVGPERVSEQRPSMPAPSIPASNGQKVHVEIHQEIVGTAVRYGLSAEDVKKMMEVLGELKQDIDALPVDRGTKLRAKHLLDSASIELAAPEKGIQPEKGKVKAAIEESAGILKSAGTATEQLSRFIKKAQDLAPLLGQSMEWLGTLF
ncbi:MAG: ATP-binding protein [Desulfobacteraceae bacterium]